MGTPHWEAGGGGVPQCGGDPSPGRCVRPPRAGERGQATAETTLALPVLLWVLLATVGLGHMLYAQMVVTLAADYGGREAAIAYGTVSLTAAEREQRARQAAENVLTRNLRRAGWDIAVTSDGTDVTVDVTYPYAVFVPGLAQFFPGGRANLRHTAIFRIEPQ